MTVYDFGGDPQRNDNVTKLISKILKNYDIRLRPNFGGMQARQEKAEDECRMKMFSGFQISRIFLGDPLYIGMDMTVASFDGISEVNMVSIKPLSVRVFSEHFEDRICDYETFFRKRTTRLQCI
jgi:hypothetical protein